MKSGMYLTKADVFPLVPSCNSAYELVLAVQNKFACGISLETATKIIADFNSTL